MSDIADAARAYKARGWNPIPLKPGDKAPRNAGWQTQTLGDAELNAAFANGENVGVALGTASGGLLDADLDAAICAAMASHFLPKTGAIFGRPGKPDSHRLYVDAEGGTSQTFRDPLDGAMLAEFRADGLQTMMPPSRHPSGESVAWVAKGDPATVPAAKLIEALGWLCTAACLVKHWGEWATRHHELMLALAGGMLKGGKRAESIEGFVRVVCHHARDHEPDNRVRAVRDTARRFAAGEPVTGWKALAEIVGWKAARTLQGWLGIASERGEGHLTDLGNAERLAAHHGDALRYCADLKRWYVWDGKRWAEDVTGDVYRRAMQTIRSIPDEAKGVGDKDARAAILKWAIASENERRIAAMVRLSERLDAFAIRADEFDRDAYLLNTPTGTVNLRTGGLSAHDPADLITKITAAPYAPGARYAEWDRFLVAATEGIDVADGEREPTPSERNDAAEMRAFLQRLCGYSATGVAIEEVAPLIHGPERSGKSTVAGAVLAALGDYAKTADFETFLKRQHAGGVRTDLVRLAGTRMVASVEVDDGKDLAAALFKRLTGGDEQLARGLYTAEIVIRPTATFWLFVNHAPRVDASDGAMWRRILRVPFPHTVPPEKRDPRLKQRLTDPAIAGPAVLAWIVEGCLAWQRDGLHIPESVTLATAELRDDMNPLGDFLNDRCELDPTATVPVERLHVSYLDWARQNGIRFPLARKRFGDLLERHGCERAKGTGGVRVWRGVKLNRAVLYDVTDKKQANPFTSNGAAASD